MALRNSFQSSILMTIDQDIAVQKLLFKVEMSVHRLCLCTDCGGLLFKCSYMVVRLFCGSTPETYAPVVCGVDNRTRQ
jgi:hypothetical protein